MFELNELVTLDSATPPAAHSAPSATSLPDAVHCPALYAVLAAATVWSGVMSLSYSAALNVSALRSNALVRLKLSVTNALKILLADQAIAGQSSLLRPSARGARTVQSCPSSLVVTIDMMGRP